MPRAIGWKDFGRSFWLHQSFESDPISIRFYITWMKNNRKPKWCPLVLMTQSFAAAQMCAKKHLFRFV